MDFKEFANKFLKGCGCVSIICFVVVALICIFVPDEEEENKDENQTAQTEQLTELTADDLKAGFASKSNI